MRARNTGGGVRVVGIPQDARAAKAPQLRVVGMVTREVGAGPNEYPAVAARSRARRGGLRRIDGRQEMVAALVDADTLEGGSHQDAGEARPRFPRFERFHRIGPVERQFVGQPVEAEVARRADGVAAEA